MLLLSATFKFQDLEWKALLSFRIAAALVSFHTFIVLGQVEKIANRGGFGSTSNVHVDAAHKSISLVMFASAEARRPPSTNVAQQAESCGDSNAGVTDAHAPNDLESGTTKYVAAARLRVTAKLSQG